MQPSIVAKYGHTPPLWSHPDIYAPHFFATADPISGRWAAWEISRVTEITDFKRFWPRISGSQTSWVSLGWPEVLLGRAAAHRRASEEKKTSRGISVDFPKYLGLSLPVCLSGSEQPLDTSQEKSDSDIPFQDGECWDKYGGAGDADQGAGAGEHDFEVSAGQVPDHLQLARRDCRQTGLVSFSFVT